ncbi:uncharacterized protein [Dysidea avara]|uniref:uncharacterized protein n=1 Tax=Dysidea avara TaxID=196820 RepID=UPI003326CD7D
MQRKTQLVTTAMEIISRTTKYFLCTTEPSKCNCTSMKWMSVILLDLKQVFINLFTAEEFPARTERIHQKQFKKLKTPAADVYKVSFGISRNSTLNELKEFHVTSGLPPDIMHDIFEGVAVVELHCMLSALIQEYKLFGLAKLNNRIKKFPYGIPDRNNKPLPLPVTYLSKSPTEALKQNSSQTWCLLRLLPLIIGDCVPNDNPNWANFLRLLMLVDYVTAPETTREIAGYLRDLIQDHHTCFKQLYPERRLTPKFHHLVHLPHYIIQYGPLVRMWCMRYEAKHCYFKRWAKITGNYKNIAKSLPVHHQKHICYKLADAENFLKPPSTVGPATLCDLDNLSYKDLLTETCHGISERTIYRVNWVEIMGTTYKPTILVIVDYYQDVPIFGEIHDIISVDQKFYLATYLFITNGYNPHYHAYEV